jgi:hypothetical protein
MGGAILELAGASLTVAESEDRAPDDGAPEAGGS